jgi:hypothetical protein
MAAAPKAPKVKADPFDVKFNRERGYAGFTASVRKIHEISLQLDRKAAEVEAVFPGLFKELEGLQKAKADAGKEFKEGIPTEIVNAVREQKQVILACTTALSEVEAAVQFKERKPTLNQIAEERYAALVEKLGKEIADSVIAIEAAVIEQNKKIDIALIEARTIDRETGVAENMRTAGVLNLITKAIKWVGSKIKAVLDAVRMTLKIVKTEGTSIQKACDAILKETKRANTAKAASQKTAAVEWKKSGQGFMFDDVDDAWSVRKDKNGDWFVAVILDDGTAMREPGVYDDVDDAKKAAEKRARASESLKGMKKMGSQK